MQRRFPLFPWFLAFVVTAGVGCQDRSQDPKDKAFEPKMSAVSEHRFLIEADREDDSCQDVGDGVTECLWEDGETTCRQGVLEDGSFVYQYCSGPGWQYDCDLSQQDNILCQLTNGESNCTDTWSLEFNLIDTDCDFGHHVPQDSCVAEENNTRRCTFEDEGYNCSALLQEDGSLVSMECINGIWRTVCNHSEGNVTCELYTEGDYTCTDVWTADGEPVDMGCDRYHEECPRGNCNYYDDCNGTNCPCNVLEQNCESPDHRCWPYGIGIEDGQCFESGERTLGQPCVEPPVGEPESCVAGLICVAEDQEAYEGICVALCGSTEDCPGEQQCLTLDYGEGPTDFGICWRPDPQDPPPPPPPPTSCTVLDQDCQSGLMCVASQDYADHGICVETGSLELGSNCYHIADCLPGLQCVAISGWNSEDPTLYYFTDNELYLERGGTCRELCPAGDHSACVSGDYCEPLQEMGPVREDVGICYTP